MADTIEITEASRSTAEGTAIFRGEVLHWMAYFKTTGVIRVMISREVAPGDWRWYPHDHGHGARTPIGKVARTAMAEAKKSRPIMKEVAHGS